MIRKTALALTAAVLVALGASAYALAQTNDAQPDGNGHPNVGALLAKRADGSLRIICSGTLVTPRVFLTAGVQYNSLTGEQSTRIGVRIAVVQSLDQRVTLDALAR